MLPHVLFLYSHLTPKHIQISILFSLCSPLYISAGQYAFFYLMNGSTLGPLRTIHLLLQPFVTRSTVWTSVCAIEECRKFLWDFILDLFFIVILCHCLVNGLLRHYKRDLEHAQTKHLSLPPAPTASFYSLFHVSKSQWPPTTICCTEDHCELCTLRAVQTMQSLWELCTVLLHVCGCAC